MAATVADSGWVAVGGPLNQRETSGGYRCVTAERSPQPGTSPAINAYLGAMIILIHVNDSKYVTMFSTYLQRTYNHSKHVPSD